MTQTYRVTGMTCESCARAVSHAIAAGAPGTRVSVDLKNGLVTIEGAIADGAVSRAVAEAGFGYAGPEPA